jgi:ankyrin repeat protein
MRNASIKFILLIGIVFFLAACAPSQIKNPAAAAIDADPQTSFFEACRKGDMINVMRLVEENRVDVNLTDPYSWTGFMYAIQNGHEGLAEYFLR